MIPHRIKMTGLLSYKEQQEVCFDGAPLWMLAGVNGSGKSSIFDGVTYALFGHHRGGSQNASELINKDSTGLAVEFDFKLDGELYRIKRTLRKNPRGSAAGTQQIFRRLRGDDWAPVPDTSKKVDFDAWIHDKIGLTYETFTSSVLLLQGKAEKLLDARPSGRAEVLAGIVDLERYQRLYEAANKRKLELKGKLEELTHQTAAVPVVEDEHLATAILKIDGCEEARREVEARIDGLVSLELQAARWSDTQSRLAAVRQKLAQAESLLGEAVKIEKAFARLNELRGVLPAADTVVTMRAQSQESQRKTDLLLQHRAEAQERKKRAEHDLALGKSKRDALKKSLAEDEKNLAEVNVRLRELHGLLEKVRLVEHQESELRGVEAELAGFPADPEQAVRDAQTEADRLTELHRILPILERFQTERHELSAAQRAHDDALKEQARIQHDGEGRKQDLAKLQPELERAKESRAQADEQVAVTRTLAGRARAAVEEFATLKGARKCSACGQPLTKEHYAQEKANREQEATDADRKQRAAIEAQAAAVAREQELAGAEAALKKALEDLRTEYKEQQAHARQAAADVERLTKSLALRYAEMPDPYRHRIAPAPPADWTQTRYPERDELVALRREAGELDAARLRLRDAGEVRTKWTQLRARADSARQTLRTLRTGLPDTDLAALRQEHVSLQGDETSLIGAIKAAKKSLTELDTEIDKLGQEAHAAVQVLTDLAGKLQTEEVSRKHCGDAIASARKNLPPSWQAAVDQAGLGEYSAWKSEEDQLTAAGTEAKHQELEQARGGLNALRQEITAFETEAAAFPAEARRSPDEVKQLLAAARQEFAARDEELQSARREKATLDGHRGQRAKLGEQYTQIDGQFNRYKILSELLGRDRLQRHLVRQAERHIVDYANAVLDRLSGGQLFLRLVGGDDGAPADKALDLECSNRVTGTSPINVAFLSGSQKFRVAVSLALGIGQYASRQHRPIESVIIDEGFGCLDRQGRQVMIQELQNLRGHLHCILLVSHQDEFADAFPDGYRFELENGATKVTRFQR